MTDANKTLIAALLDRSGSMSTSKSSTEKGFNQLIKDQAKLEGTAHVTLAQFDGHGGSMRAFGVIGQLGHHSDPAPYTCAPVPEFIYKDRDITSVPKLTLVPRGNTPLLDAIGNFVTEIGHDLSKMREADRPGTVIAMIMTDGQENASQSWDIARVRDLITQQESVYKWKFLFLGSNIDAVAEGAKMGFATMDSMTYDDDSSVAVASAYASTSNVMGAVRGGNLTAGYADSDRNAAVGK